MFAKQLLWYSSMLVFMLVLLSGCTKKTGGEERTSEDSKKIVVGVPARTLTEKYMTYVYDAVRSFDESHTDVEFRILDAQLDAKRQLDLANNMILDDVAALLVIPVTREIVLPIGKAAKAAGIPLVLANNLGTEESMAYVSSYVGSREEDAGRIQAEYIGEKTAGEANVAVLMGPIGHAAQIGRTQGLSQMFTEKFPAIKILGKQPADWDRSKGLAVSQDLLQAYPNLTVIVANNDEMAIGALLAAQKAGIPDDDLLIGGVDATPDALEYLGKGLDFTVFQDAPGQGRKAAEAAYQLAKGESVEPRIWIPFELVTPDNIKNYQE